MLFNSQTGCLHLEFANKGKYFALNKYMKFLCDVDCSLYRLMGEQIMAKDIPGEGDIWASI